MVYKACRCGSPFDGLGGCMPRPTVLVGVRFIFSVAGYWELCDEWISGGCAHGTFRE